MKRLLPGKWFRYECKDKCKDDYKPLCEDKHEKGTINTKDYYNESHRWSETKARRK